MNFANSTELGHVRAIDVRAVRRYLRNVGRVCAEAEASGDPRGR